MLVRAPIRRRPPRRRLALLPLVAATGVVASLVVAFVPNHGTQARWSNSVSAAVPHLTMDRFNLTSVSDTSNTYPGFTVTNNAARTTGFWAPRSFTISPLSGSGTTASEATSYVQNSYGEFFLDAPSTCKNTVPGQGDYYYPSNNAITSGVPDPVTGLQDRSSRSIIAPQAKSHFCVRIDSNFSDYDELRYFAGRAFTLDVSADMLSEAPATWRSAPVNSRMKLSVPFPQPRLSDCLDYTNSNSELQWSWLDGYGVPPNNAIDRWEVQRWNSYYGYWETIYVTPSDHDVYYFGAYDIPNGYARAYFRLVAFPYSGSTYYASTGYEIEMYRDSFGYIRCGNFYPLPYQVVMP